jgi:hypothetical protein
MGSEVKVLGNAEGSFGHAKTHPKPVIGLQIMVA